jgi:cbb3-type cytochrome oxidase subunit 3
MKQEALTQFPLPVLPTIGLLIFFVFFVGMLIYISRRTNKLLFQQTADLPLVDGISVEDEKL